MIPIKIERWVFFFDNPDLEIVLHVGSGIVRAIFLAKVSLFWLDF